jgi:hypothetical protein
MDSRICSKAAAHVDSLGSIATRLRAGETPRRAEFEREFQDGVGCLIELEARVRTTAGLAVEPDGETCELRSWIDQLSRAVHELRTLCDGGVLGLAAYGFVLPRRRRQRRP